MATKIKAPYVKVTQNGVPFYLTRLFAVDLVKISYVARRGIDEEAGAVQRLLNGKRIAGIRDFAVAGGPFPVSIVLNWTNKKEPIGFSTNQITIPREVRSAQIIDGQHRVAGLEEAIAKKPQLKSLEIPLVIYNQLSTNICADIFLSINTEQKPVPKSLVFDLYEVASDYIVDPAAARAADLAAQLNDDESSPYFAVIKFPGAAKHERGIALSTIVGAVKPLIEPKGAFEQVGLSELHMQAQFLINFFTVLKDCYGDEWLDKTNAFRYAAGFIGAIEFIKSKLIVHCNLTGDFTEAGIRAAFRLNKSQLIHQSDIEGLQGRKAYATVAELLEGGFDSQGQTKRKIKV